MLLTILIALITISLYIFQPYLGFRALKKVLGISLYLQIFYLVGYYFSGWPFPEPFIIIQIVIVVALGVALGAIFSKIWPLAPRPGFERVVRTFLIVIPALGLGVGLQILLQGAQAELAIYLIFALSAWLGSGHFVRLEEEEERLLPDKRDEIKLLT